MTASQTRADVQTPGTGGKDQPIKLIKSTFFDEASTKERLARFILDSHQLSMGPQCAAYEAAFSRWHHRAHTVLFNSGSSANLALIQALLNLGRLQVGDEVAFSAVTWSTNVMPLMQLGLVPIPVDCDVKTINVDSRAFLETLERHPRLKGFFISNILGFCGDLDRIRDICTERGNLLIEDNCESFGSVYRGTLLGNFGVASTCSSFVGHHLSTIEGGTVVTDDAELAVMLRMVRAHGWDRNLSPADRSAIRSRFKIDPFYDLYTFYELGYNLRPTEITGFLGQIQVEIADRIVERRASHYAAFRAAASRNSHIVPLEAGHLDVVSNFAYPVVCDGEKAFDVMRRRFSGAGVEIRPIVGGNMAGQPFFKKYDQRAWALPNAEFVHRHGFYFPNNPELTRSEVERLVDLLGP